MKIYFNIFTMNNIGIVSTLGTPSLPIHTWDVVNPESISHGHHEETLNFHISFWELQACVLLHAKLIFHYIFADQCQGSRQP